MYSDPSQTKWGYTPNQVRGADGSGTPNPQETWMCMPWKGQMVQWLIYSSQFYGMQLRHAPDEAPLTIPGFLDEEGNPVAANPFYPFIPYTGFVLWSYLVMAGLPNVQGIPPLFAQIPQMPDHDHISQGQF